MGLFCRIVFCQNRAMLVNAGACHEDATIIGYEGGVTGTLADSGEIGDVLSPPRFS